ncbi:hypothetical protein NZK32_03845 [Cyanobium sp. FGCU-52]|nr:hypothetical protein [Cyanobium sp. FGCU52]
MAERLRIRLRPRGGGRFFTAAFLSVWLCGWAMGEVFALMLLVRGARALLVAGPATPAMPPPAAAVPMGLFLLVWLSFWTIGGLSALRQLLGCFAAEDRLELDSGDLLWQRWMGPFRRRRRLPLSAIHGVRVAERSGRCGPLVADLARRTLTLSELGTAEERREAARQLQEALGRSATEDRTLEPGLPQGWACLTPPLGVPLLVPDPGLRRRQAQVMAAVTLVLGLVFAQLIQTALAQPSFWPLTLMVAVPTVAAVWGTLWLALGRLEWRLESRRMVLQRRFGGQLRERFEARALELHRSIDSDGDHWYDLMATDLHPAGGLAGGSAGGGRAKVPASHSLLRRIHDPAEPRQLGRWLERQCALPFNDPGSGD